MLGDVTRNMGRRLVEFWDRAMPVRVKALGKERKME